LGEKVGMPRMRIMTDLVAEHYWTVVAEMEVPSLQAFEDMMKNPPGSPEDMKQVEELMKGYHDLVDHGSREIYKIEGCPTATALSPSPWRAPGAPSSLRRAGRRAPLSRR